MEAGQEDIQNDLRALLLKLYLKNNPQIEHKIFIYSYHGVVDVQTNRSISSAAICPAM